MFLSSLKSSRSVLTCTLLLLALNGCAQNSGWAQRNSWVNPSTWFGGNVDQKEANSQTSPDISQIKGPLTPPEPAPREPVQVAPLPTPAAPIKAKVALLVPLTGKNAALGQAMQNAAQQAVFDSASNNFELMPRDTGDNDVKADAAARDAIGSGAQLLIGPVFSSNIPAVKAVAQTAGVDLLTLSNDTSYAAPDAFVMGFTPGPQVDRVVSYAASKGLHHFAVLLPANAYGSLIGQVFKQAVARTNGVVVASEVYDPAKHDSEMHIRALAMHRDQVDALLLPEGGQELVTIAVQLNNAGFDSNKIRLLGTGLWDEEGLGMKSSFLQTGWFAGSDPAGRKNFIDAYKASYGQDPPRIATLAYDATAMAAVIAKRGGKFDSASLSNPNGFAGLDGIFRLTPQGYVERGLAIMSVTSEGTRVVDPAPTTFAGN